MDPRGPHVIPIPPKSIETGPNTDKISPGYAQEKCRNNLSGPHRSTFQSNRNKKAMSDVSLLDDTHQCRN